MSDLWEPFIRWHKGIVPVQQHTTNEGNLGAPMWSQLTEPAGGVRSQGIFEGGVSMLTGPAPNSIVTSLR